MIQISYGNTRTNLIGFRAAGLMKHEQMMTEFPLSEDFKIHLMGLHDFIQFILILLPLVTSI